MNTLLIDAGNSNIKWSLLSKGNQLSEMESRNYNNTLPIDCFKAIFSEVLKGIEVDTVMIVSVLGDTFIQGVKKHALMSVNHFINTISKPYLAGITNAYEDYSKLGADRLVALVAAYHLNENDISKASIVVDSGTATTIDAIDKNGTHLGGVILSGLDLCSQSLLENTELLPLFNKNKDRFEPSIFSTDTSQAIVSGSIFGLAGAISHISFLMEQEIRKRENNKGDISKIITGGAAEKLQPYLNKNFQIHNNLLMLGLKVIAEIEQNPKNT